MDSANIYEAVNKDHFRKIRRIINNKLSKDYCWDEYFNHAVDKGQIKVAEVICDNCSVYFYDETIEKILYQSNNEKIFNFLIKSSLITGRYEIDIDIDRVDESKKNKLYNNVCLALAFFRSCIKRRKVYDTYSVYT